MKTSKLSIKGQIVSILGFVGCTVSPATTELRSCSVSIAIDSILAGGVSVKLVMGTKN